MKKVVICFQSAVEIPRIRVGKKQTFETLITEEVLLFAKYIRMSKQLKIEITGQDQSALFANDFHIMHTPNDFVLSVVEAIPQMQFSMQESINQDGKTRNVTRLSSTGIMRKIIGRYGMSPASFKKMVGVMNTNLKQF